MPKLLFPCICHDEVLLLAPHCSSQSTLAVLFLQEQCRMDFDCGLVRDQLPRDGRSHISLVHRPRPDYQNASCQQSTTDLSSRCFAYSLKALPLVLKAISACVILVSRKRPDSAVDQSKHLLHLLASESRPGYCKEAQYVPYGLSGQYVFSDGVVSQVGVHYVPSPWFIALCASS